MARDNDVADRESCVTKSDRDRIGNDDVVSATAHLLEYLRGIEHGRQLSPNTVAAYRRDLYEFAAFLDRYFNGADWTWDGVDRLALRGFLGELSRRGRARLEAQLSGARGDEVTQDQRSGLGVGSLVLILIAAGAFMIYGAWNDINPLQRGKRDVRLGDFASARKAFDELGLLPEARAWSAITWLAEGRYDKAFEVLLDPTVRNYLASFRPLDEPLEPVDADRESGALLPRGLVTHRTPSFVYDPGPEGVLTIVWYALDESAEAVLAFIAKAPTNITAITIIPKRKFLLLSLLM
jgi:hypothetical protein